MPHPLWTRGLFLMYPRTRYTCSTRQVRQKKVHIAWSSMIMHQNEGSLSCELPSKTGKSRVFRYVLSFSQGKQDWKEFSRSRKNRIGSNKHNRLWARFDLTSPLELQNRKAFWQSKTRTGSVQKVCGGVWQGFDHLTKLESSKVEVVLQWGLRSSSTL